MIREITLFNGGINNLTASHFLDDAQATYIQNANITDGTLTSHREKKATGSTISGKYGFYYRAQDKVVTSNEDRFYVEWGGFLYWSNSAGTLKRYDGITVSDIGSHTAPVPSLAVVASATAGLLDGDYWYTYTYVHDTYFESPPAGFTQVAIASKQATITISGTPPASVTAIRIYRSGGLNPTFNLLAEVPKATTTYTDNISDFLISRTELATYNNANPPSGLDMLVENSGVLFGVLGNKVYFSQQGQPEYWSEYNYVQVPQAITGLGVKGEGVVIFTANSMYLLTGDSLSTVSINMLPFGFGCKDKRSVQLVEGSLVWVAEMDKNDVICVFNGSSVSIANMYATSFNQSTIDSFAFDDLPTNYDSYNFTIKNSLSAFSKYFLFMQGRTAVVDFLDGAKVYYVQDSIDSGYIKGNNIYVIENGAEYDYLPDFSNYRNITYRTKNFIDGMVTQTKSYRMVKISAAGSYTVSIVVDGKTVETTTTDKIYLPAGITGTDISFSIQSSGYANVKAIAYEYELLKE